MLTASVAGAESKLDSQIFEDRIARLNGGICKLKIIGPSTAEVRERKDRAEDAIAAVRGAIKHGVLPGGCWTLMRLAAQPTSADNVNLEVFSKVIAPSMMYPFMKILENAGYSQEESLNAVKGLAKHSQNGTEILNVSENKWGEAFSQGVLDSVPAVLESIRNSFSIASNLGTIGGIIVFERDDILEREEASQVNHFAQSTGMEGQV
jgi:chaperonin GroEL